MNGYSGGDDMNKMPSPGRRMPVRRLLLTALVLLLVLAAAAAVLLLPEKAEPAGFDPASMKETGDPDAEPPVIHGEAAELYISGLEQPVYQKNADKRIDPYSITKILTCYLAIRNLDLDQVVEVSEYAATPLEDGTTIFLQAGEKISVRDLLYGAMLESGNDAATALGEAVSGSEAEFAKLMNRQAKEWGCKNTHFVNANGWKDEDHYTTAHDMALITARSFENKVLSEIAMTREYVIPATNLSSERHLESHTLRGKQIKNITGGKTGGWTGKDSSIAVAFRKGEIEGAAVVLRDRVKYRKPDASSLTEFSAEVTPGYIVTEPGKAVCEVAVRNGESSVVKLCTDETIYAYPKDHKREGVSLEAECPVLEAPVARGDRAGTYTLSVDGKVIKKGELYAAEDVPEGGLLSRLGL